MGGNGSGRRQGKVKVEMSSLIKVVEIPLSALTWKKRGKYDIIYNRLEQMPAEKAFQIEWKEMGYKSAESLCSGAVTYARKKLGMAIGSHIDGDKCYLWKRSGK